MTGAPRRAPASRANFFGNEQKRDVGGENCLGSCSGEWPSERLILSNISETISTTADDARRKSAGNIISLCNLPRAYYICTIVYYTFIDILLC